jgi:inorganic phosphate transporter, PiT family
MELLLIIIVLSLLFDYINGFHDAANSIATIVSTKVLTPFQAVLWAAAFNFVAFFIAKYVIGGFGIANTISKTVMEEYITLPIILSGVIAAIIWNLFTWWKGIFHKIKCLNSISSFSVSLATPPLRPAKSKSQ